MSKKVNFGIVGGGAIATFHADAINDLDDANLVGLFDPNPENAKAFSEKYGIKAYGSYSEMLEDAGIDAVCICTPSGFHAENAMDALNSSKHVVLEKPMAFTAEEADKIIETCKKSKCILSVISQLRFSDDIRYVKKLVEENAFGTVSFCDLYMKYWRNEDYYSSSPWKGTLAMDGGGALMNQGIHGVDIVLYIMGEAKLLHGKVKTMYHKIETEDTAVALVEFKNGAMGVIEGSTCSFPGYERKIEIMGSTGSVIIKENRIEKLVLNGETVIERTDEHDVKSASDPMAMSNIPHKKQISNFIGAINGTEKLFIDANEGKKAVSLIEKIYNFLA